MSCVLVPREAVHMRDEREEPLWTERMILNGSGSLPSMLITEQMLQCFAAI